MTDQLTRRIIRLYLPPQPKSLAVIGERLGMSRQAVQQRLDKAGVPRRSSAGAQQRNYEAWVKQKASVIERAVARSRDHRELAAKLEVPLSWVRRYLAERFGTAPHTPKRFTNAFTDDDLLDAMRSVASTMNGDQLAAPVYDQRRADDDPSSATMIERFGNWGTACRKAGVKHRKPRREYEPTWTRDTVLDAVKLYVVCRQADEQPPLALDYEAWRAGVEAPSLGTIRKHFGSWRDAVWAALA